MEKFCNTCRQYKKAETFVTIRKFRAVCGTCNAKFLAGKKPATRGLGQIKDEREAFVQEEPACSGLGFRS